MPRALNPEYIRCVMRKEELRGLEVVFLTGMQFGVSGQNESLLGDGNWVDDDAPRRYAEDAHNYKGWNVPGKLYCVKCWSLLIGIPREILLRNWCEACESHLYSARDERRLDYFGFALYRDRVTRYSRLGIKYFAELIEGAEHLGPNGGMQRGYHKDHMFSVRDAFEKDIEASIVSCPPNIRVLPARENQSKGRRSGCTIQQLLDSHRVFLSTHPEWPKLLRESDDGQESFVFEGRYSS